MLLIAESFLIIRSGWGNNYHVESVTDTSLNPLPPQAPVEGTSRDCGMNPKVSPIPEGCTFYTTEKQKVGDLRRSLLQALPSLALALLIALFAPERSQEC